MKSSDEVRMRIEALLVQKETLRVYLDMVVNRPDWHGVMDAAADLRDTEAEIEALRWVVE